MHPYVEASSGWAIGPYNFDSIAPVLVYPPSSISALAFVFILSVMADTDDVEVKAMLHELAAFKPQCPDWGTSPGCRRGKRCKFRHCSDDSLDVLSETPSMSRFVDSQGRVSVVPRPPLTQALTALFQVRRTVFLLFA